MVGIVLISFFVLLILGVPVATVVFGSAALGVLGDGSNGVVIVQQLFSGLNNFTLLAVPFFIVSGDIAAKGKTSEKLINTIMAFMGHRRGGLGMATIIACAFFGAITGSAIATVVAIGAFMLPKLLERGYPRSLALGIITSAGSLGIMIPPSVPMLTICLALSTSVSRQFTAGFLPGILVAAVFCVYTWIFARKANVPLEPKMPWKDRLATVKDSIWALLFPVIILGGIYLGIATATEAAVVSLFYILFVELFIYKSVSPKELWPVLCKSFVSAGTLTITIATAKVFTWYLTTAQIPSMIYNTMSSMFTSRTMLLFAICVLFLIAGCFTNVTTVITILGPILAQTLTSFNIDLIHFGIVAIMMCQCGFLTPPFGLCLFVSMKVGKASMGEIVKGSTPFLLIMLLLTVVLIFVPQISLFLPNLILGT